MGLNDEIGNFSKRREVEVVTKRHDAYEEEDDDWDDDKYEDAYDFKMYKLDELDKFNAEVKELEELISPWWKNLKTIFRESTLSKIGLIEYRKKSLLADDAFESVSIGDTEESLDELKTFGQMIQKSYWRRFKSNIYGVVFYVLLAYWTGWNVIVYFLIGWSLYDMVMQYLKYAKQKEWLLKAKVFIEAQNEIEIKPKSEKEYSRLEDIMDFNAFVSKEENEHWSIKIYDAIANFFTKKK
jgi:hypothetical protein